jgi:hypothetical protein
MISRKRTDGDMLSVLVADHQLGASRQLVAYSSRNATTGSTRVARSAGM